MLGNLYVVSAPSGTGKTTLVKALVDSTSSITVSISHTTRPKRSLEMHGVNYYFVDEAEFRRMISHQDFLEYANVFNHLYGTSKTWVKETLAKGIDVILEIDWQGAMQIKKLIPGAISIFILPPSLQELRHRLISRNQDKPEIINQRITDVKETVSHIDAFDYVVMNDDFSAALNDLKIIVGAGRLLEKRQAQQYHSLLNDLLNIQNIS